MTTSGASRKQSDAARQKSERCRCRRGRCVVLVTNTTSGIAIRDLIFPIGEHLIKLPFHDFPQLLKSRVPGKLHAFENVKKILYVDG